jgi:hypothetical protein
MYKFPTVFSDNICCETILILEITRHCGFQTGYFTHCHNEFVLYTGGRTHISHPVSTCQIFRDTRIVFYLSDFSILPHPMMSMIISKSCEKPKRLDNSEQSPSCIHVDSRIFEL